MNRRTDIPNKCRCCEPRALAPAPLKLGLYRVGRLGGGAENLQLSALLYVRYSLLCRKNNGCPRGTSRQPSYNLGFLKISHSVRLVSPRTQRVRGHHGRLGVGILCGNETLQGLRLHCGMLWPSPARPRLSAGQGTALAGRSDTTQQSTQQ